MGRFLLFFVLAMSFIFSPFSSSIASAQSNCSEGDAPEIYPEVEDILQDLNDDPAFRSGTVPIWNDEGMGQGFILRKNGGLYLATVEHVARMSEDDCTLIWIPGTDLAGFLDPDKFEYEGFYRDEVALYPFSIGFATSIRGEISDGVISPFTISNHEPEVGEIVMIPRADTGRNSLYVVTRVTNERITLETDGSAGIICQGRSGGPARRLDRNGNPTSEVYGVVSQVSDTVKSRDGRFCGYTLYVTRLE